MYDGMSTRLRVILAAALLSIVVGGTADLVMDDPHPRYSGKCYRRTAPPPPEARQWPGGYRPWPAYRLPVGKVQPARLTPIRRPTP